MKIKDIDNISLNLKYFHYISTFFVLSFVISNILAIKIASIFNLLIPAGMVSFPLSYIFSDILTEVYGFQRARQLIWFTIFCEILIVFFIKIAIILPPSPYWPHQNEFSTTLNCEWRIVIASCIAYLFGDYTNCTIISKLKLKFGNNFIVARFISSTALGVLVDNSLFTVLAFTGILPYESMLTLIFGQYLIKLIYETLMSPISVKICNWLKKEEGLDIYDLNVSYDFFKVNIDEKQHQNNYQSI